MTMLVAALIGGVADRPIFAASIRRDIVVEFCADSAALHSLIATEVVDAVIADLDTARHASIWPSIRAIVDWHPTIPLVLWLSLTGKDMRELVAMAAEVALDAVIIRELDDATSIIQGAVRSAREGSATLRLVRAIERIAPPSIRALLVVAARSTERPLTVHAWAARAGISQRTLLWRLRDAGLPHAREVIRWLRLLHVAARLDLPKNTVEHVVEGMRFASSSTLRHLLKRMTGFAPTQLREAGGFQYLLSVVEPMLRRVSITAPDQDSPLADLGRLDQRLHVAGYESRRSHSL